MRTSLFITLCACIACSQKPEQTETAVVASDTTAPVAETVYASAEPDSGVTAVEIEPQFSWPFTDSDCGPDIFTTYNYDSMKIMMEAKGMVIAEKSFVDNTGGVIISDSVNIGYNPSENGGLDITSAVITRKGFPLKSGIYIGMPKDECMETLNIKASQLKDRWPSPGTYFQYTWPNPNGGIEGLMEFSFDDDDGTLKGFDYRSPCSGHSHVN